MLYSQNPYQPTTSLKMGFGDDIKEFENDATGQGGNDGDNNANKANGQNDKTEDTMVDSGSYPLLVPSSCVVHPHQPLDSFHIQYPSSISNQTAS